MYEKKSEPLLSTNQFYQRVIKTILIASAIIVFSLFIGIIGFHYTCEATWIDSLHNSSMLLSGMGPVINITNTGGKIFSSSYALFSGVVFITNIGVILAPLIHRLYHHFHLEEENVTS